MGPETPIGEPGAENNGTRTSRPAKPGFLARTEKRQHRGNPWGDCIMLDMRHLGEKKINERLPLVRELASSYVGHDPVTDLVPVRPVIHFMMGGIDCNGNGETQMPGLLCPWRDSLLPGSTAPTAWDPIP